MQTTPIAAPRHTLTAAWIGALALACVAGSAQGQTLTNNTVRLATPVTTLQPSLRTVSPTVTLRPTTIQPSLSSTTPAILDTQRIAPTVGTTGAAVAISPAIGQATVATTGLGRLVAPGTENANVVVARIGATAGTAVTGLTADFDGDGLINFEIAPGVVELGQGSDPSGGDALNGLVGRHVSMGTDTAGRVLDSVINTDGIVPAATFEVSNGTVVLGGFQPTDTVARVDVATIPDGPVTPGPDGGTDHDPGRTHGDDRAGKGDDGVEIDPTIPGCQTRRCDPNDPLPGPANGPGLPGPFSFSGHMPPMPGTSDFESEPGDLIDVSIMLPLRGREREADQFSNYGNEEIW